MTRNSTVIIDGGHQGIGGVERLNTVAIEFLGKNESIHRGSFKNMFREVISRKPGMVIVDLPLTWRRLFPMAVLRIICFAFHGGEVSLVLREHNYSSSFEVESVPNSKRFRTLLRLGYALVDRIVCVSHAQENWMKAKRLCRVSKIQTLVHAVDIEGFLSLSVSVCPPVVFGAIGRMTRQKGFDVLIKAWKNNPCIGNARLMIGGAGPEETNLKAQCAGVETVEFVGEVKNRKEFYEKCSCVIVPSRWEPYGQVCLEARAAARPVIVSDVDGLPEQTQDQACGLIFQSGDSSELAMRIAQMQKIVQRPDQFNKMCLIARVSAVHTRENFQRRFSNFLHKIANDIEDC